MSWVHTFHILASAESSLPPDSLSIHLGRGQLPEATPPTLLGAESSVSLMLQLPRKKTRFPVTDPVTEEARKDFPFNTIDSSSFQIGPPSSPQLACRSFDSLASKTVTKRPLVRPPRRKIQTSTPIAITSRPVSPVEDVPPPEEKLRLEIRERCIEAENKMYERLVRNGVVVDPPLYRGGSLGEASGSVPSDTTGEAADQVSDLPGQKTD